MQKYKIDLQKNKSKIIAILEEIAALPKVDTKSVQRVFKNHPSDNGQMYSKSAVYISYKKLKEAGEVNFDEETTKKVLKAIQMKRVRTISGVTPVTVFTKPFPCPGKCIFCPNDVRMPKSYLSDEPGAQRAELNKFDPYLQTFNRLVAFRNTGHNTDKIELLVLGGTWSVYPEAYQIWFIKRCFDAMNDFGKTKTFEMIKPKINLPFAEEILQEIDGSKMEKSYNLVISSALAQKRIREEAKVETATWEELFKAHKINETVKTRCIGLVIETRPDEITKEEVIRIRKLGATKVQIGIQSLNDEVLQKNKRGHDVAKTREAINLLRSAGFKIHAHWMPNLYGSTPEKDIQDYKKLFDDPDFRPDELKIYPCSLIASAELMHYYKKGLWKAYTHDELLKVLKFGLNNTSRYCRLTRVIRDIPSTDIVVGNKKTNFRQIAEQSIKKDADKLVEIRSREIKGESVNFEDLKLNIVEYETGVSKELFMEYITAEDKIAGFLRLSFPKDSTAKLTHDADANGKHFIKELTDCAIIREIHVYGKSLKIGKTSNSAAQHLGMGKTLIKKAKELSSNAGFKKLAVISSIGTREYYKKNGFEIDVMYQIASL